MSTRTKFQRAQRIIPNEENLDTRDFVLYDNALYFAGDRAWFKIENFMESDVNCLLRFNDLTPILSMGGEVTATKIDDKSVEFKNDKHTLTLHVDQLGAVIPAVVQPLPVHEYEDLPDIISRGRNIFGLLNEFATASIGTVEEPNPADPSNPGMEGYLALLNEKTLAVMKGEPGLDMDLTDLPEVTKGLIAQKAKVKLDNQLVHSMVEEEDYTIYASFKHGRSRFPEKRKRLSRDIAHGLYEADQPQQPVILLEADVTEFIEILPVLDTLKHQKFMTIHAENDTMNITVVDNVKNVFHASFPCTMSEEVRFEAPIFDRAMLDFLVTAVGSKLDETKLQLCVNPWKYRLILRAGPNEDDINALCMLKITN